MLLQRVRGPVRTRNSKKVKVVDIASKEKGLLEGRRQKDCDCGGPEWANLHLWWHPGCRTEQRYWLDGRWVLPPTLTLGLVSPCVLIFEWENMLPAVSVRVSAGNRWHAQIG